MHKVKRIRIRGFRRLRDVDIEMRPLMVMIGANGVGKSSLLDAISLLSASADGRLNQTLNDMGGIVDVSTRDCPDGITLETEMDCPGYNPLKYELHLDLKGQTYSIARELVSQSRDGQSFKYLESYYDDIRYFHTEEGRLAKLEWEHNPKESALSQVPKMFKQPEDFRRILSYAIQYHVLDVGKRAPVKLPQQMKPVDLPGVNGEDLVSFLYSLREGCHDRYEMIEDSLKSAFPSFESMNFPPAAAGMLSLTWKENHFKSPLYMHQLSEGTLRFLWLISLLQSPGLSTVTMIDEPEVSLHPELLSLLADLMREASARTQVIVATHSDRLVRFLEPNEVMVLDIDDDGHTTANWGDSLALDEWLEEYSLDDVWRMGRMGGRA
ncbi:MAG: AAA family ATPase [Gammaproteobacteria bacterium]|nr:AAA family ATPase [Gammaproteobacteria bacterium]